MNETDILDDGSLSASKVVGLHPAPLEADAVLHPDERMFEARMREHLLRERREEHELRKTYIRAAFVLVISVTFIALFLTVSCGQGWLKLSDTVVITLLTTTTANVIGILLIAFNWLFPKR